MVKNPRLFEGQKSGNPFRLCGNPWKPIGNPFGNLGNPGNPSTSPAGNHDKSLKLHRHMHAKGHITAHFHLAGRCWGAPRAIHATEHKTTNVNPSMCTHVLQRECFFFLRGAKDDALWKSSTQRFHIEGRIELTLSVL